VTFSPAVVTTASTSGASCWPPIAIDPADDPPAREDGAVTTGATTHDVCIDRDRGIVVKRFRECRRGEPAREWSALTLLATFAPGLAPAPLGADLDADPPVITMSCLTGTPLGGAPPTPSQAQALAAALERLWRSVPSVQHRLLVEPNPAAFTSRVHSMLADGPHPGDDPAVRHAHATASAWFDRWAPGHHRHAGNQAILGQGDPNLANFLWDGGQIRIVDFEDSGPSDRAYELASLTEHISAWSDASLDTDGFLAMFDLSPAEQSRVRDFRRLAALFWLILLRPGSPASARNPSGTLERQADRLLNLFG
jgi:hypothetical protein